MGINFQNNQQVRKNLILTILFIKISPLEYKRLIKNVDCIFFLASDNEKTSTLREKQTISYLNLVRTHLEVHQE